MIWPASSATAKSAGIAVTALLFLGSTFTASGQAPLAVLEEIAERPLEKALQVEYEFNCTSEPLSYDQSEVDRKVEEFRQQLLSSNAAGLEELVQNYRKSLERKTEQKLDGRFVMGPDFLATYSDYLPDSPAGATWDIRQGTNKYVLVENETLTIMHDPESRTKGEQDIARDTIGRLGKLNPEILRELKDGKMEAIKDDQGLTLKKGNLTVKLKALGDKLLLSSIEQLEPAYSQRIAVYFEDYKELAGLSVPTKVTDLFENRTGRLKRVYHVKDIKFADDYLVPLVNRDIGLISVTDFRFTPKIRYLALRQLPLDAQIAEWVADPGALKKYNAAMRKIQN